MSICLAASRGWRSLLNTAQLLAQPAATARERSMPPQLTFRCSRPPAKTQELRRAAVALRTSMPTRPGQLAICRRSLAREGRRRRSPVRWETTLQRPCGDILAAAMPPRRLCGGSNAAPCRGLCRPHSLPPKKRKKKNLAVRPAHLNEVEYRRNCTISDPCQTCTPATKC